MKLKTLRLKNFRGYYEETSIDFSHLTAFVGKNYMGKSSILEALDIFLIILVQALDELYLPLIY